MLVFSIRVWQIVFGTYLILFVLASIATNKGHRVKSMPYIHTLFSSSCSYCMYCDWNIFYKIPRDFTNRAIGISLYMTLTSISEARKSLLMNSQWRGRMGSISAISFTSHFYRFCRV